MPVRSGISRNSFKCVVDQFRLKVEWSDPEFKSLRKCPVQQKVARGVAGDLRHGVLLGCRSCFYHIPPLGKNPVEMAQSCKKCHNYSLFTVAENWYNENGTIQKFTNTERWIRYEFDRKI